MNSLSLMPAWMDPSVKAADFNIVEYVATLSRFKKELLRTSKGRVMVTSYDPLLFAYLYLRKHITNEETGKVSIADCHLDWCRMALEWVKPNLKPRESRYVIVAPRESGKTTWNFLILPLWGAAHGYIKFASAFSSGGDQAQNHLKNFKRELDERTYPALYMDFPDLCTPMTKRSHRAVADSAGMIIQKNGFTFSAHGIESGTIVGAKSGHVRPDHIILDDVEPGESQYSAREVEKRLVTIRDDIIPLGKNARIVWSGYATMVDSLIHQVVRYAKGGEQADWIKALNFKPRHYPAIVLDDNGDEESIWPDSWTLEHLKEERQNNPRGYAKNFDNDPIDNDGTWWRKEDIHYLKLAKYDRNVLIVDGAVTTKQTSDETGLAVVSLDIAGRRFFVREGIGVRQAGEQLRTTALQLIEDFGVQYVMVEANQAGDLWHIVFHDMPVKVVTFTQKERKEYRIRRLLASYQRDQGRVFHERELPKLERQALAYPHVQHEDILDGVAAGVQHLTGILLKHIGKNDRVTVKKLSYT